MGETPEGSNEPEDAADARMDSYSSRLARLTSQKLLTSVSDFDLRYRKKTLMKNTVSILLLLCVFGLAHAQDTKSLADYRAEAEAAVDGIDVKESMRLEENDEVVFVDIRDSAEVEKSGKIAGADHVPRGMLEFFIDPKSPMHNKLFQTDKKIVFYCATGGRSLFAAKLAQDMGIKDATYLEGGFRAWSKADGATE